MIYTFAYVLKNNMAIMNDNDVKCVYRITTSNVAQHIAFIVHFVGLLVISFSSSSSSSFQIDVIFLIT